MTHPALLRRKGSHWGALADPVEHLKGANGAPSPRPVAGPVGPCSKGVATTGRAGEPGQGWGKGDRERKNWMLQRTKLARQRIKECFRTLESYHEEQF